MLSQFLHPRQELNPHPSLFYLPDIFFPYYLNYMYRTYGKSHNNSMTYHKFFLHGFYLILPSICIYFNRMASICMPPDFLTQSPKLTITPERIENHKILSYRLVCVSWRNYYSISKPFYHRLVLSVHLFYQYSYKVLFWKEILIHL